ncbi:recombinase family protein [Rubrobacter marinus]|nr:recombinase family protein [Rubrobacter marinus]
MPRAVLYARVSTEEQKNGFSISDQLRTLRDHARREGLEVVEECVDDGYPGSDPDRPGLMRAMELAERGAIGAVVATKRDRLFRSRLYRLLMDRDLEEYGVSLVALNDTGNRIGDGVQDDFAEYEREQITQRTAAGRREKARQGKVIAGRLPDYGYRYGPSRDSYVVVEEEMRNVRRVISSVASGSSLHGVVSTLDAEGVPAPNAGKWQRTFARQAIYDDCYRPHAVGELEGMGVAPEVLARLDKDGLYGVWWYNRRGVRTVRVPTPTGHKKSRRVREKPREQWIAVPVPPSGLAAETVDAARRALADNEKSSKAARRDWELSGGVLRCPGCDRALVAVSARKKGAEGRPAREHHYYACTTRRQRGKDACSYSRTPNAEKTEAEVWAAVRGLLLDPARLRRMLEAHKRSRRRRSGGPEREAKRLAAVVAECDRKRAKDQEMFRADAMTLEELRASLAALSKAREDAEAALRDARARRLRADEEEAEGEALMRRYEGFAAGDLDALGGEARREVYNRLGVTVVAARTRDEPLRIVFGALGGEEVCHRDRTSTR